MSSVSILRVSLRQLFVCYFFTRRNRIDLSRTLRTIHLSIIIEETILFCMYFNFIPWSSLLSHNIYNGEADILLQTTFMLATYLRKLTTRT